MNLLWIIPTIANLLIAPTPIISNNNLSDKTNISTAFTFTECYNCNILSPNITDFNSEFKKNCKPKAIPCKNNTYGYIKYNIEPNNLFNLNFSCEYDKPIKNIEYDYENLAINNNILENNDNEDFYNDNTETITNTQEKNNLEKLIETLKKSLKMLDKYLDEVADISLSTTMQQKQYIKKSYKFIDAIKILANQQDLNKSFENILYRCKELIDSIEHFENILYKGVKSNKDIFSKEEYKILETLHYMKFFILNDIKDYFTLDDI